MLRPIRIVHSSTRSPLNHHLENRSPRRCQAATSATTKVPKLFRNMRQIQLRNPLGTPSEHALTWKKPAHEERAGGVGRVDRDVLRPFITGRHRAFRAVR